MKFNLLLTVAVALRGVRAIVRWCSNAAETTTAAVQDLALQAGVDAIDNKIKAADQAANAAFKAYGAATERCNAARRGRSKALDAVLNKAVKA